MARYHVVNESGSVLADYEYGFTADAHAGELSDKYPGALFIAIDTRDGSVYGSYRDGEEVPAT